MSVKAMNNGCKYCAECEDLPEDWLKGRPVGKVFDTSIDCYTSDLTGKIGWFIEIDEKSIGIQYCPMCGRKLPNTEEW